MALIPTIFILLLPSVLISRIQCIESFRIPSAKALPTKFLVHNLKGMSPLSECTWVTTRESLEQLESLFPGHLTFVILTTTDELPVSKERTWDIPIAGRHVRSCSFLILLATSPQDFVDFLLSFGSRIFNPHRSLHTYVGLILTWKNNWKGATSGDESLLKGTELLRSALNAAFGSEESKKGKERIWGILNHPWKVVLKSDDDGTISVATFNSQNSYYLMTRGSISRPLVFSKLFPRLLTRNGQNAKLTVAPTKSVPCGKFVEKSRRREIYGRPIKELLPIAEFVTRLNFSCEFRLDFKHVDPFQVSAPHIYSAVPAWRFYYSKSDLSPQVYTHGFGFCYLKSEPAFSPHNIHKPLTCQVWVVFILSWISAALTFYLIGHTNGDSKNNKGVSLFSWMWETFSSLLLQGISKEVLLKGSRSNRLLLKPLKLFLTFWFPFLIVMNVAYTSNLVSILTSPEDTQELPGSYAELVSFGWKLGTPHERLFQQLSHNGSFDYLLPKLIKFRTENDCLELLLNSTRFACLGVINILEGFAKLHQILNDGNRERFVTVRNRSLPMVGLSMGWRWWSPFRSTFRSILHHLVQGGFPLFWKEEEERKNAGLMHYRSLEAGNLTRSSGEGGVSSGTGVTILNLFHLQGCFMVLVSGWIMACSALVLENIVSAIYIGALRYYYRRYFRP